MRTERLCPLARLPLGAQSFPLRMVAVCVGGAICLETVVFLTPCVIAAPASEHDIECSRRPFFAYRSKTNNIYAGKNVMLGSVQGVRLGSVG